MARPMPLVPPVTSAIRSSSAPTAVPRNRVGDHELRRDQQRDLVRSCGDAVMASSSAVARRDGDLTPEVGCEVKFVDAEDTDRALDQLFSKPFDPLR